MSDVGCVRRHNEDRFLIDHQLGLFVVADGMGGHGNGDVAADLAIRASHFFVGCSRDRFDVSWPFGYDVNLSVDENRLKTAVLLANRQVYQEVESKPAYAGMGTTIVALIVSDGRAAVCNVGDSRAYLMRHGEIRQWSVDDSWIASLVKDGTISEQEARVHSTRNVLTQAIGSRQDLEVHTREEALFDGDVMALTTDGVHGVIEPAMFRSILYSCADPSATTRQLIEAAKQNGGPDNASCIVLRYQAGAD